MPDVTPPLPIAVLLTRYRTPAGGATGQQASMTAASATRKRSCRNNRSDDIRRHALVMTFTCQQVISRVRCCTVGNAANLLAPHAQPVDIGQTGIRLSRLTDMAVEQGFCCFPLDVAHICQCNHAHSVVKKPRATPRTN